MKAIEVTNLTFGYSETHDVIRNVSFSIEEGSYVAIIGHNGSGKSTLAKILIGLLNTKSGKIKIFDQELNRDTVYDIRKNVGIVFQNPDNQFISATVEDDIAFGLENKCVPTTEMGKIVLDYATKVGMKEFLDKEPSNLSGGQKQRVAIAGVLAMSPKIVIFDEATSMLDPKGRKDIRDLIKKLKEANPSITILSITHDVDEAYQSDYVLVMNEGKVALSGTPNEVFKEKELLTKIGLSMPLLLELKEKFKDNGLNLDKADTLEEMVDMLCR